MERGMVVGCWGWERLGYLLSTTRCYRCLAFVSHIFCRQSSQQPCEGTSAMPLSQRDKLGLQDLTPTKCIQTQTGWLQSQLQKVREESTQP